MVSDELAVSISIKRISQNIAQPQDKTSQKIRIRREISQFDRVSVELRPTCKLFKKVCACVCVCVPVCLFMPGKARG